MTPLIAKLDALRHAAGVALDLAVELEVMGFNDGEYAAAVFRGVRRDLETVRRRLILRPDTLSLEDQGRQPRPRPDGDLI